VAQQRLRGRQRHRVIDERPGIAVSQPVRRGLPQARGARSVRFPSRPAAATKIA